MNDLWAELDGGVGEVTWACTCQQRRGALQPLPLLNLKILKAIEHGHSTSQDREPVSILEAYPASRAWLMKSKPLPRSCGASLQIRSMPLTLSNIQK